MITTNLNSNENIGFDKVMTKGTQGSGLYFI